jgi:hypothetical protein
MENHTATEILNSSSATYIRQLASTGVNFTQSFALTHPSQPNYIQLFSGSAQGVTTDGAVGPFTAPNLYTAINGLGKSFKAYSEDLPSVGYTGTTSGNYAKKHAPWASFSNVPGSLHVPFTQWPTDYSTLPAMSFVIPNLIHDMHDGTDPTRINDGDQWLQDNLSGYAEWARTHNSLLIVTFDEDDSSANNQIATIAYGANMIPGSYAQTIDHYSVLGLLLDTFGAARIAGSVGKAAITAPWTTSINLVRGDRIPHLRGGRHEDHRPDRHRQCWGDRDDDSDDLHLERQRRPHRIVHRHGVEPHRHRQRDRARPTRMGRSRRTQWNWGDGTTAGTGATAAHLRTAGTKTITLTVTDNSGAIVGDLHISSNTATVANYDVGGRIIVDAGITVGSIENCRVRGSTVTGSGSSILVDTSKAANRVIVRGCEIAATSTPDAYKIHPNGIGTRNYEAYRNWIHHVVDGGRLNTGAGTHADLNAAFYANFVSDHYVRTPDPGHATTDNKTHADGNQGESGFNASVHGNAFHSYHSTDGTSNVEYTVANSSGYQLPAQQGDAGAVLHPQSNPGLIIATWYVRNISIYKNWFYGADRQLQIASSSAANSTGTIWGNRHERRVVVNGAATKGPFFSGAYIYTNGSPGFTIGTGANANVFMDDLDGTSPVPVS